MPRRLTLFVSIFVLLTAAALGAAPQNAPPGNTEEEFAKAIFFGKKFFEIGDYKSALASYARADSLQPDLSSVTYNLAFLHTKLGQLGDAQSRIDRYRQLFPTGPEAPLIARLQLEVEFEREVQRQRQADQEYLELFNRGKFQHAQGNAGEALKLFQEAERRRVADPAPVFNQGVIYEKSGDFVRATERFRRFQELTRSPADKTDVDRRIFGLEKEITDMRTRIVCPFCGLLLPEEATWCPRCWHGPFLTSSSRFNTRVCGSGAAATRTTFHADGRVARNEELACLLKDGNLLSSLRYSPAKRSAIRAAREAEGWSYNGEVIERKGDEIQLEQGEYLLRLLANDTGDVLHYAAHRSGQNHLLDSEELVIDGQKYLKKYSYDSSGRLLQERVTYLNNSPCNHLITVTADYTYENGQVTIVRFHGAYTGYQAEGSPQAAWDGQLVYAYDSAARIEKEDLVITSQTKTYQEKPVRPYRDDLEKIYANFRIRKPIDILKRGDYCALSGTSLVGEQIDLRPFYSISPNIGVLLPFGVSRLTVSFTYPESFTVR